MFQYCSCCSIYELRLQAVPFSSNNCLIPVCFPKIWWICLILCLVMGEVWIGKQKVELSNYWAWIRIASCNESQASTSVSSKYWKVFWTWVSFISASLLICKLNQMNWGLGFWVIVFMEMDGQRVFSYLLWSIMYRQTLVQVNYECCNLLKSEQWVGKYWRTANCWIVGICLLSSFIRSLRIHISWNWLQQKFPYVL